MTATMQGSGAKKAAIFLMSIGEQASAEVLKQLSDAEVKTVSKAIARLETVPAEETERVLEEIFQLGLSKSGMARGGVQYAKRMLATAFGPDNARALADQLPKPGALPSKDLEK